MEIPLADLQRPLTQFELTLCKVCRVSGALKQPGKISILNEGSYLVKSDQPDRLTDQDWASLKQNLAGAYSQRYCCTFQFQGSARVVTIEKSDSSVKTVDIDNRSLQEVLLEVCTTEGIFEGWTISSQPVETGTRYTLSRPLESSFTKDCSGLLAKILSGKGYNGWQCQALWKEGGGLSAIQVTRTQERVQRDQIDASPAEILKRLGFQLPRDQKLPVESTLADVLNGKEVFFQYDSYTNTYEYMILLSGDRIEDESFLLKCRHLLPSLLISQQVKHGWPFLNIKPSTNDEDLCTGAWSGNESDLEYQEIDWPPKKMVQQDLFLSDTYIIDKLMHSSPSHFVQQDIFATNVALLDSSIQGVENPAESSQIGDFVQRVDKGWDLTSKGRSLTKTVQEYVKTVFTRRFSLAFLFAHGKPQSLEIAQRFLTQYCTAPVFVPEEQKMEVDDY
ncbi:MAG: hypothetical protein A3D96_00380 [Chlamydiae bacterium RIFCSPHIGHO2_12_FULL_44_59]|nr:MAG: hypothetical protein A2796_07525 [Chlamydiae bacterium RIFCSPHIGHO2_01_FULL_44_39]OGN59166.1 MAG: hypothetical protein A3C42_05395 [Chlamydiae bacterium RIFCSPHIGHO2_02_FULL_45_9]OGN60837.1 MAG: hypothetical protein A3D96_00380 [Chlamydiae bacterium RIFCSPHIGHO2_12_FULL_44_59]OGN66713.1 MAG: hypothetical protein A2978_03015 [Chlamydiae bacterium RIFCSPLOWO2_01_FULL_44_52]OGN67363.1 MAG: hypothetical protein A3I67_06210 [Chlamydiae bacterium RIFCSPLOWO2_02_FULL_45_22]OGN70638.1 MAG: hyp